MTKVWNKHVIKAGIYVQRSRKDQTSFANSSGESTSATAPAIPTIPVSASPTWRSAFTQLHQASQYATGQYRYTNAEWYVQDTFKVTAA